MVAALALVVAMPAFAELPSIDPQLAAKYFEQLEQTSARDRNELWGKSIYGPIFRLVDEWGILDVGDGAWLMRDTKGVFMRAQVDAPASASARPVKGRGWSLELKEGWSLVAGERPGDFRVSKESAAN